MCSCVLWNGGLNSSLIGVTFDVGLYLLNSIKCHWDRY